MKSNTTEEEPKPHGRRRKRLIMFLLSGAVFLSGIVVGASMMPFVIFHFEPSIFPSPQEMPRLVTERMERKLDLTDEQSRKIHVVLERYVEDMEAYRTNVQSDITVKLDQFRIDMTSPLTPEQAIVWTEHFDKMREKAREKHLSRRPPFLWAPWETSDEK